MSPFERAVGVIGAFIGIILLLWIIGWYISGIVHDRRMARDWELFISREELRRARK